MDSDRIEDQANEFGKKIHEGAARAVDDQAARAEGLASQAAAAGQNLYAQAKGQLRDAAEQAEQIKDYPLASLLLAGVAGFVAGVVFRRV